jgi:hypothetical protein
VNTSLWFGALTTLAGAALGGVISYVLSRQQIKDARAQRLEAERSERARRSEDRRLDIYADFLTRARTYRNVIRKPGNPEAGPRLPLAAIADLARTADAAGSLVHLVSQSEATAAACGEVMRTIGETSGVLHAHEGDMSGVPWEEINGTMSRVLRAFQVAARAELRMDEPEAEQVNG